MERKRRRREKEREKRAERGARGEEEIAAATKRDGADKVVERVVVEGRLHGGGKRAVRRAGGGGGGEFKCYRVSTSLWDRSQDSLRLSIRVSFSDRSKAALALSSSWSSSSSTSPFPSLPSPPRLLLRARPSPACLRFPPPRFSPLSTSSRRTDVRIHPRASTRTKTPRGRNSLFPSQIRR